MTRKERYAARRAQKLCVDCGRRKAKPGKARCRGCARIGSLRTQDWQRRNRRRYRDTAKHRMESLYWSNPHVFRGEVAAMRLQRKIDGICRDCPAPSLEDNVRCARCRRRDLKRQRIYNAKRRKRLRREAAREVRTYRPIDGVIDLTRVRILRAARSLDWTTFDDLFDLLGGGDDRQRNTTAQMLGRLTKAGRFERRRIPSGFGAYGAWWEYLITPAGVAELDGILHRVRSPGARSAA